MAPLSVRRTHELVSLVHRTVVYELITAAQAVDMRGQWPIGRGTAAAYRAVRDHVPMLRSVRGWDPDIEGLVQAVSDGEVNALIAAAIGGRKQEPRVLMVQTGDPQQP